MSEVIAANCFFNDHDGRFENVGLYSTADKKRKVARIDFGTALSRLNDPIYCLGMYLFGKGRFDPRHHYAETYGPLLKSEKFRSAIQQLSTMNLNHIQTIVQASVTRFVASWQDVPLNALSIQKLYSHLFGAEDQSSWISHGYVGGPPVHINFDQFHQTISESIVSSMQRRKDIFSYFAKALAFQETRIEDPEQALLLTQLEQEAMHDDEKSQLLNWLGMSQTLVPVHEPVTCPMIPTYV